MQLVCKERSQVSGLLLMSFDHRKAAFLATFAASNEFDGCVIRKVLALLSKSLQ